MASSINKLLHLFISSDLINKLFWIFIFSLAMGFLEAIVVVYLRNIYYPGGFGFPMSPVSPQMYKVELIREIATLLMLLALGYLVGKKGIQKMAYFLIGFATWDMFYYVALKMLLNWPESLMTWDVLFLIPLPWLGPVLAPIIVSLTMIWIGISILILEEKSSPVNLATREWLMLIFGAMLIFCGFIWNYSALIIKNGFLSRFSTLSQNREFLQIVYNYTPEYFNWGIFITGEIIIITGFLLTLFRYRYVLSVSGKEVILLFQNFRQHIFH